MSTTTRTPKPPRPLGPEGTKLWKRIWGLQATWIDRATDLDHVLVLCESIDERVALRVKVLRDPDDWRTRNQLRNLDGQINDALAALGMNPTQRKALRVEAAEVKGRLAELRAVRGGSRSA